MDWDGKISSIFDDTETSLERLHQKVEQARHGNMATNRPKLMSSRNMAPYEMSQSLRETRPQHSEFYSTHNSRLSSSTAEFYPDDFAIQKDRSMKYLAVDKSPSIVALMSEKINSQDKAIELLNQRLQKKEEEQEFYVRQLRDLQDVVNKLQHSERVGGPQVDMDKWKDDVIHEVRLVHRKFDGIKSNAEISSAQFDTKIHNITSTVYDLRTSITGEIDFVRRELEALKLRLGTVEMECSRAVRQYSSVRPDNENEFKRSLQPSFSGQSVDRGLGSRNVSFTTPTRSSQQGMPDLAELQNDYLALQNKLKALESNLKMDGRKSRKPPPKKSFENILSSPNTSDLDLTSASEQFTSSSRGNSQRNRSANNNTITDDFTTDDCLSLDELM